MRTHYHVIENVPGYVPETEPYTVTTKAQAVEALRQWKSDLYDSEWDLPRSEQRRVYGNAERDLALRAERPDPHDLGLVIEAVECSQNHGPAVIEVTHRPRAKLSYRVALTGAQNPEHDGPVAQFRARGDANAFALELRRRIEQYEPVDVQGVV